MTDPSAPESQPEVDLDHLAGGRSITISGPLGKVVLVLVISLGLAIGAALWLLSWF